MALSKTTLDGFLNAIKGTTYAWPATAYVTLLTTNPSDNIGTGLVEVAAGSTSGTLNGYTRLAITSSTFWNAPTGASGTQTMTNAAVANFGTANTNNNTFTVLVVGFAVYDAASTGNLLAYGSLLQGGSPITITINNGDVLSFPAGNLSLTAV